MKIVKGIFTYTMLIIGALFIIGLILLGAMYLLKLPLFGYTFKNINIQTDLFSSIKTNQIEYKEGNTILKLDAANPKVKLVINAGNYNVRLLPDESSNVISYYTVSDFTGFVKDTSKTYNAVVNTSTYMKQINGQNVLVVNMNVVQPEGLISFDRENNRLVVVVPENYTEVKEDETIVNQFHYDCEITTTGGNISLCNSELSNGNFNAPLRVSSIVANTEKGDIKLGGFERDAEDSSKPSKEVVLDNLVMTTKGGTFDFTNFEKITVNDKFTLESTKADYLFDKLVAKKGMEINGTNVLIKANEITCPEGPFVYKSDTGGMEIGTLNATNYTKVTTQAKTETTEEKYHYEFSQSGEKLNNISIFSGSANIVINNLMGKARIENDYGYIKIDHMANQASIKNINGNITINKSGYLPQNDNSTKQYTSTSSMVVYNTYGNIEVNEYYQNGLFSNVKGSIKLNSKYNENVKNGSEFYYTKLTTKDGNVEFVTWGNAYSLEATDKANISITQNGVNKLSNKDTQVYYAKTTNGSLSGYMPTTNNASGVNVGDGYIMYIDGSFASTPTSTFVNLKPQQYQYYFVGEILAGTAVENDKLEDVLKAYPLIKLVSDKTYIYAQL